MTCRLLGYALVGLSVLVGWARLNERRVVWAAERMLWEADAARWDSEDDLF